MKKFNKIIITGVAVLTLAATSITAFALTQENQVINEDGIWEEYKDEMLKNKKEFLDEKVAEGAISQEEADEIYAGILERQEYCTGNGYGFRGMMRNNNGRGCGRGWQ